MSDEFASECNKIRDRLGELCDDFARYEECVSEPNWRREMQRAVLIEMMAEMGKLADRCRGHIALSPGDG